MSVRMGIDLGTAFAKVAVRAGQDVVVIDWSELTGVTDASRWFLPVAICQGVSGEYSLASIENGRWIAGLKHSLLEMPGKSDIPAATVAFVAQVICYARAYLYTHSELGTRLRGRTLRWELNIGCPTQPYDNERVVERFRRLANVAWGLAGTEKLYDDFIGNAWRSMHEDDGGLERDPEVVPEFVAQIAAYLRSPNVRDGLHALIDVGAATVDIATFNIVPSNEGEGATVPIFFSEVAQLGTHFLRRRRHERLGLDLSWDDGEPVEGRKAFSKRYNVEAKRVAEIDGEFTAEVERSITRVIDATRTNARGDPGSGAWEQGLPMFVTGGGAECRVYREALARSERVLQSRIREVAVRATRFRFIRMNVSASVAGGNASNAARRLTVALGLTEDAEDIARIVPQRLIPPVTKQRRQPIDHEDIYSE